MLPQIQEAHKVYGLAAANISLNGLQAFLVKIEPTLSVLLLVAQLVVAVATAIYTIRQIRKQKTK